MKTAFIPGTFAPLHKGSQFLIEMALKENERVIVMVYEHPDMPKANAAKRADWIKTAFASDDRLITIPCHESPATGAAEIAAIKRHLPQGTRIDGVYCNEDRGRAIAKEFGALWHKIDPERTLFPISSASIRSNPMQHRDFLPEPVADTILASLAAPERDTVIPFRRPAL